MRFFLEGVESTATEAVSAALGIRELFARDRARIAKLGRAAGSALRLHELLQRRPLLDASQATQPLDLSAPTVRSAFAALEKLKIVRELTGKQRDRLFAYGHYLDVIAEGTGVGGTGTSV